MDLRIDSPAEDRTKMYDSQQKNVSLDKWNISLTIEIVVFLVLPLGAGAETCHLIGRKRPTIHWFV